MTGRRRTPHVAAVLEDGWNRSVGWALRRLGFTLRVVPHIGYASEHEVRVLARVLRARSSRAGGGDPGRRRGWRNFVTAEAPDVEITIVLAGHRHVVRTDRSGNIDVRVPNPGLTPGLAEVVLDTGGEESPAAAPVLVVDPDVRFGIISDIDDTVIKSYVPRPLLAAYNAFVATERSRRPVPGMADCYAEILGRHPGAPVFYVSTGAWNVAPKLGRFMVGHGLPLGPMLLTDWGPTNSGWFRSGREHKHDTLRRLAADFPSVRWLLVGDDGQHDPVIYAEFAAVHPERVVAIALRVLAPTEQLLAHGTPGERDDPSAVPAVTVPEVSGRDGAELASALRPYV